MAKKPTTTGRDYGHRTYMDANSYPDAMSRPSDKSYDNHTKRPHSHDKKPYLDDDYPEMEHYWTPFDMPNFIPPGVPDDPRIPPNNANQPPDNPPDPIRGSSDIGCIFGIPVGPSFIIPGDTTFRGIGLSYSIDPTKQVFNLKLSDPLVRLYVNYGPAILLTDYRTVNNCLYLDTPTCLVSAQAMEDFDEEDYAKLGEHFPVQIVAETQAGLTCTWDFYVIDCPPEVALEYDTENSAETIAREDTAAVYVTGGIPPYEWEVSGEGYTLQHVRTNAPQNTLIADADSCGTAIITVTDECEDEVTGYVRNTTGYWDEKTSETPCGLPGALASWNINCIGGVLENLWPVNATVTVGYQKQYHQETMGINTSSICASETEGECESCRVGYSCGPWSSPCLSYPGSWTLTKPPGTCGGTVRWQGNYEEVGGLCAITACIGSFIGGPYETWGFRRAYHQSVDSLRYWEWECA